MGQDKIEKCLACNDTHKTTFQIMELNNEQQNEFFLVMKNREKLKDFMLQHVKIRIFPCWHCRQLFKNRGGE